ncbi:tautomerase family protein [Lactococcus allomyrinae]|uniref:Tautomerase family protein n=1 Tax=Lactococcus allomyrinae TaxID=2419773 RepID=A0A387BF54_9LACT|nr:tautomerase family protein [Lactococcus allomyrinae]AYG01218.1 tautomerase family protein [Lactococcus allomyrinae]
MPLINIDLYDKWTKEEAKVLLNGIHRAVLSSFGVPERDRYQILHWHKEDEMILEDTGLGFERDKGREVVIQVISRKRTEDSKIAFYKAVAANLKEDLALNPKNLLISIVENGDADWSFADGEAQFLTGKL